MNNATSIKLAYKLVFKDYPDIIGIKEICEMLNISPKKAYQLIHSGEIQRIPCGKTIKVAKITLLNYVLQNAQ